MNTDSTTKLLEDIDAYVECLFAPPDEVLEAALRESRRAGLPEINVSPNGGRLLQLFAELVGARRILEIGTLGGYSAIHFARVLPEDGTLISLELEERHAEVARANVERAGLAHKVEVQVGDARELLAALAENDAGPLRPHLYRCGQGGLPRVPGVGHAPLAAGLASPRRQHRPRRERARPTGRIGAGHAGVQRAGGRKLGTLGHRAAPDPGAHRRHHDSPGPLDRSAERRTVYMPEQMCPWVRPSAAFTARA